MTVPLILLAIPSLFLGLFLGLPLGDSRLHHWLDAGLRTRPSSCSRSRRCRSTRCSASTAG